MPKSVYIETTIPSYLTARPSRDLVRAARQQVTREWWETRRQRYELFISELVLEEAARGDPEAAAARLRALEGLPLLEVSAEAVELAGHLVTAGVFPEEARPDALHVAVTAENGIDLLATWNCKHLANGDIIYALSRELWSRGYAPLVVCTLDELMGE